MSIRKLLRQTLVLVPVALLLAGCNGALATPTATPTPIPPTSTPVPPTATPEPTPTPTMAPTGLSPSKRSAANMAYDSESDKIILFGGWTGGWTAKDTLNDTWAYDFNTNTWTKMAPPSGPGARQAFGMAYDAESDRVIMFGGDRVGSDGQLQMVGSTWAYDFNTNTWEQMSPPESPSPRMVRTMVYDAQSDRIILWGGWTVTDYLADTWVYDFNTDTWTEMAPQEAPPGVHWPAMAYDAESDVVVAWGDAYTFKNHVWVYDFDTDSWMAVETTDGPARRELHTMVYDAESDRIILYGGDSGRGGTWAYDYNSSTWTELQPDVSPILVVAQAMAYNSAADRVVLFSGQRKETWAYDFNTDTWKKMAPVPSSP